MLIYGDVGPSTIGRGLIAMHCNNIIYFASL